MRHSKPISGKFEVENAVEAEARNGFIVPATIHETVTKPALADFGSRLTTRLGTQRALVHDLP